MNAPSPHVTRPGRHANRWRGGRTRLILVVLIAIVDLTALGIIAFEVRALWPLLALAPR
jgi:hypothetical protein